MDEEEIMRIIEKFNPERDDVSSFAAENNLKLFVYDDIKIYIADDSGRFWVFDCDIGVLSELDREDFEKYLRMEWDDDIVDAMIEDI